MPILRRVHRRHPATKRHFAQALLMVRLRAALLIELRLCAGGSEKANVNETVPIPT